MSTLRIQTPPIPIPRVGLYGKSIKKPWMFPSKTPPPVHGRSAAEPKVRSQNFGNFSAEKQTFWGGGDLKVQLGGMGFTMDLRLG